MTQARRVFTHTPWEARVGYCRAQRVGNQIAVTGTAPVADDGRVFAPGDAYAQARRCLEIIEGALRELGAEPRHVIRTRMFVVDISRWEAFGRAHAEFFAEHPPATSMVEVRRLIEPEMLIEIEADAIVDPDDEKAAIEGTILSMERAALDRWCRGDPSGYLEICAPEVTYFDPFVETRIDGLEALSAYYEALRGKVNVSRYEILNPEVAVRGGVAILTFNYVSSGQTEPSRWNCTEVYVERPEGWRILQTHWSLTGRGQGPTPPTASPT